MWAANERVPSLSWVWDAQPHVLLRGEEQCNGSEAKVLLLTRSIQVAGCGRQE